MATLRLSVLLLLLAAIAAPRIADAAAAPPSLGGQSFKIDVFAPNDVKLVDKIVFKSKVMAANCFPEMEYKLSSGKGAIINFEGSIESPGGTLVVKGTVNGQTIQGTVVKTPKGGEAQSMMFNGKGTNPPLPKY